MLPESLQKKLKGFERRLFVVESVVFVCGGLLGLLISFLLLFLSDRFWDTPVPVRIGMTLTGCVVFGFAAAWWARYWLVKRRDSRALAKMIQKSMGGIGDRLLGAVELAEGTNLPDNVSPALCAAAIKQVAEQMEKYDFKAAVEKKRSRVLSLAMIGCFLLVAGLLFFVPAAFWNSLSRWGKPVASVPRYTFVSIEALPPQIIVPHGEAFNISIRLTKSTFWKPETALCRFEDQPEIEAVLVDGTAQFDLPGQVAEGELMIRLGDVRKGVRILPVFRPELVEMRAEIKMPDYLGYSNLLKRVDAGSCEVLEGSEVRLSGAVSRDLSAATFTCGGETLPIQLKGASFETKNIESAVASNCVFSWEDVYGLAARQPYTVRCIEVKDMPPIVECRGLGRSIAILEDEVVKISAVADDDFGLKDLRLNWAISGTEPRVTEETLLAEGGTKIRNLDGSYLFSPIANGVAEETVVSLYASARDYRPGAVPELSAVHRIYVLSRATHAKLMQDLMERVQNRVEDLIRKEEALKKDNEQVAGMEAEKLKSREGSEQTRKNEYEERENARKLEDIAREMKDVMKELMRNSDIDADAVKNWAEMMEQMKELSKDEMPKAVESMKEASGDPAKREENLEKAIAMEKQIIEKLKQNAGKMGKTLEDMIARSFVNRLKKLAATQGEVGTTAKAILPKSVGLSSDSLPAEVAQMIAGQVDKQTDIRKESGYVYDDLGGYFNRTRREVYDEIRKDMQANQMPDELEKLKARIAANLSVSVIEGAAKWSDNFQRWADMLAKSSQSGQGGEGEGEELSPEDMEVLIELLRLRQGEEALREQTRLLEERKEGNLRYAGDARKLAKRQGEIDASTLELQRKVKHKKLKELLQKIDGEMMNAAVYLKRPQTDQQTVAIETEIIELLSGAVSQCSGGSSSGASMMLMQMMGMGAGGGSNAGGTTDETNLTFDGESSSQDFENRTVDTIGGTDEEWPEEFKEALDAYHSAMDKE